MIIYKTTNLEDNKIYIGQDTKNNSKYLGSGIYIHNTIKKYGKEKFEKEIIAWCYTKEQLDFLEKFYIQFYNSRHPNGYNLTNGGEGTLGYKMSEESIRRMKESHKNQSKETRKKISEARTGKHLSEETRNKLRRPKSEEFRKKISRSMKGRNMGELNVMKRIEVSRKVSESKKGKPSGRKGKYHTKETKRKISLAMRRTE